MVLWPPASATPPLIVRGDLGWALFIGGTVGLYLVFAAPLYVVLATMRDALRAKHHRDPEALEAESLRIFGELIAATPLLLFLVMVGVGGLRDEAAARLASAPAVAPH